MKGLFISAAVFAAIGTIGATAFAQASDTTSTAPATPAAQAPAASSAGANTMSGGAMAPAAPMGASSSASDTAAAMPAQDTNYPVCKTRSQDHCRVASQMHHHKG